MFGWDEAVLAAPGMPGMPERIGGHEVLGLAGEGGSSLVYRVRHGEGVAVLKLLRAGLQGGSAAARFEAERQALAALDHPGIVRVLGSGRAEDGRAFLLMEWVEGETMSDFCRRERPDLGARLRLFSRLCEVVEAAHRGGVIHRDLKPGNVMVARDGQPKVIDFGLARAEDRLLAGPSLWTRADQLLGTLEYMSPEQAAGGAAGADTRTDVFGLGAVLYELLTGAPPLGGEALPPGGLEERLRRLREEEPPRPSTRASGLSPAERRRTRDELDWIALKALARRRERRYQSVSALREDIERFLRREAVAARPPSAGYLASKFLRQHRGVAGTAAAVAAALAATAVIGVTSARREARARQEMRTIFGKADAAAAAANLAAGRTGPAIANLARALRSDPDNADAAFRLLMAMADGPVAIPAAPAVQHEETIYLVKFTGDGSRLLTGSTRDGVVRLWRWEEGGAPEREFRLPGLVALSASADGALIAGSTLDGRAQVWRVADGRALWTQPPEAADRSRMVRGCALSPDGARLFTAAHDGTLRAWRPGGEEIWRQTRPGLCQNVAVSADGALVAGCFEDGTLLIRAAADGAPVGEATLRKPLLKAEFLADGRLLAAAGLSSAQVFFPDGRPDGAAMSHGGRIYGASALPDGSRIVLEGDDGRAGLWSGDGQLLDLQTYPGPLYAGAIAPNGGLAALGTREPDARLAVIHLHDGHSAGSPASFERAVHGLAWHPDGRHLAVASRTFSAQVFEAQPCRPEAPQTRLPAGDDPVAAAWLLPSEEKQENPTTPVPTTLALTAGGVLWGWDGEGAPDHRHRFPAALAGTVKASDAAVAAVLTADGGLHFLTGDRTPVTVSPPVAPVCLAVAPGGSLAAGIAADGQAWLWRTGDGAVVKSWRGPGDPSALAVGGGRVALATHAGGLEIHPQDGPVTPVPWPGAGPVLQLAFSPDGSRLFAGGVDRRGHLIALPGGNCLAVLTHLDAAPPRGLRGCFSHDGKSLITWGSDDLRARLWDAASGKSLGRPLDHPRGPHLFALAPDAAVAVSWCADGRTHLFSLPSREETAPPFPAKEKATAVEFSTDGRHLLLAFADGSLTLRPVAPRPDQPLPECFLTYAEAAARCALQPDNSFSEPGFATLRAARAEVLALPGDSQTGRWMRWLAESRLTRGKRP